MAAKGCRWLRVSVAQDFADILDLSGRKRMLTKGEIRVQKNGWEGGVWVSIKSKKSIHLRLQISIRKQMLFYEIVVKYY